MSGDGSSAAGGSRRRGGSSFSFAASAREARKHEQIYGVFGGPVEPDDEEKTSHFLLDSSDDEASLYAGGGKVKGGAIKFVKGGVWKPSSAEGEAKKAGDGEANPEKKKKKRRKSSSPVREEKLAATEDDAEAEPEEDEGGVAGLSLHDQLLNAQVLKEVLGDAYESSEEEDEKEEKAKDAPAKTPSGVQGFQSAASSPPTASSSVSSDPAGDREAAREQKRRKLEGEAAAPAEAAKDGAEAALSSESDSCSSEEEERTGKSNRFEFSSDRAKGGAEGQRGDRDTASLKVERNTWGFAKMEKTYGVGFKLLKKMGFKGGGLGRHGTGVANPIEVRVREKNRGLQESGERVGRPSTGKGSTALDILLGKRDDAASGFSEAWKKGGDKLSAAERRKKRLAQTAAEIAAEGRLQAQRSRDKVAAASVRILDMTGPEIRVIQDKNDLRETLLHHKRVADGAADEDDDNILQGLAEGDGDETGRKKGAKLARDAPLRSLQLQLRHVIQNVQDELRRVVLEKKEQEANLLRYTEAPSDPGEADLDAEDVWDARENNDGEEKSHDPSAAAALERSIFASLRSARTLARRVSQVEDALRRLREKLDFSGGASHGAATCEEEEDRGGRAKERGGREEDRREASWGSRRRDGRSRDDEEDEERRRRRREKDEDDERRRRRKERDSAAAKGDEERSRERRGDDDREDDRRGSSQSEQKHREKSRESADSKERGNASEVRSRSASTPAERLSRDRSTSPRESPKAEASSNRLPRGAPSPSRAGDPFGLDEALELAKDLHTRCPLEFRMLHVPALLTAVLRPRLQRSLKNWRPLAPSRAASSSLESPSEPDFSTQLPVAVGRLVAFFSALQQREAAEVRALHLALARARGLDASEASASPDGLAVHSWLFPLLSGRVEGAVLQRRRQETFTFRLALDGNTAALRLRRLSPQASAESYRLGAYALEHVLRLTVLETLRTALVNDWEPDEGEGTRMKRAEESGESRGAAEAETGAAGSGETRGVCVLTLVERWLGALPPDAARYLIEDVILHKLLEAVDLWNPVKARVPIHTWLHPWLPHLTPVHLQLLSSPLRLKIGLALDAKWKATDRSAVNLLVPWKEIFDAYSFAALLQRSVMPKLHEHLLNMPIRPDKQNTDALHDVLVWAPLLPLEMLVNLFLTAFFPRWLQLLKVWISSTHADFTEILEWYSGWKEILPQALVTHPRVQGVFVEALQLMNYASAALGLPVVPQAPANGAAPLPPDASAFPHPPPATPRAVGPFPPRGDPGLGAGAAPAGPPPPMPPEGGPGDGGPAGAAPAVGAVSLLEYLEGLAKEKGLLFKPKLGRIEEGRQVYAYGRTNMYVKDKVIYVKGKAVSHWTAVEIEDLVKLATGELTKLGSSSSSYSGGRGK
ncbi:G-patch domain-containing protein [Besnoitia besnoiti]|uniref:G-patch domain-containing protein n=1 Tax=Besnoitia besnoiti TaxID=94643 RepID=A0A2A9MQI2_BESBE|nr:G-patch domain-containing protein [Besnoitia besnoiti]PFH38523.1 G-patch domain-containing protein [Besnoitia besnoiti]